MSGNLIDRILARLDAWADYRSPCARCGQTMVRWETELIDNGYVLALWWEGCPVYRDRGDHYYEHQSTVTVKLRRPYNEVYFENGTPR